MSSKKLSLLLALSLSAFGTACGDDDTATVDATPPDAPQPPDAPLPPDARPPPDAMPLPPDAAPQVLDLSCVGVDPPTTAPDPLDFSGQVDNPNPMTGGPVADAIIEARLRSDGSILAMTTSLADGSYAMSYITGGNAVDGYVRMHKDPATGTSTYVPTTLYPSDPLFDHLTGVGLPLFDYGTLDLLPLLGLPSQMDSKGLMAVIVGDCANASVEGATVNLTPSSGTIVYLGADGTPDPALTSTSSLGLAFVFNVDPGNVTVNADHFGTVFEAETVPVISSLHPDGVTARAEMTFTNLHP